MERLLEESGIEVENRVRARDVVRILKRDAGCKTFSVVNVAESHDFLLKMYAPEDGLTARGTFGMLSRECGVTVKDALILFPRSGFGAPIEVHATILKKDRHGITRYSPEGTIETFLTERLREIGGGRDHMPRPLMLVLKGIAADVIGYCKPQLTLKIKHAPGESKCIATFAGARECSLSFLEYLFERYGRRLVDVEFRSIGLERAIVVGLDASRDQASFPRRKEEREAEAGNKRLRLY